MAIRPPTHRASGQARRTALLQAAVEVITERGVGGASHRAIAAQAEMPLSTTSYFFASLDDLLTAALNMVADRTSERIETNVRTVIQTEMSVDAAIEQFVDMLIDAPNNDVVAQFEIYLECARNPQLQSAAHQIMVSVERAAESALRALGVERSVERAPMLVAMVDGLALHRRAWPRGAADRRALSHALHEIVAGYLAIDAADTRSRRATPG